MTEIIKLPAAQLDLDFPLMKALKERRSNRKWQKGSSLSEQELSNILWSACGITLEETDRGKCRRTAPSSSNTQGIRVYVALESGLYFYEEKEHQLKLMKNEDIRKNIGRQEMMKAAPVGLIFVSDYSRLKKYLTKDEDRRRFVSGTDAAYLSENIYLYCAAANLNTVVLGLVDREELHDIMGLREDEKVVYTQVVGRPPEE